MFDWTIQYIRFDSWKHVISLWMADVGDDGGFAVELASVHMQNLFCKPKGATFVFNLKGNVDETKRKKKSTNDKPRQDSW